MTPDERAHAVNKLKAWIKVTRRQKHHMEFIPLDQVVEVVAGALIDTLDSKR